ncbi:hypothetical protein E4U21_006228 [Claviceps maximensis]|nr:hypothetical protein E4U21_006228 [Claviceps maximensis]
MSIPIALRPSVRMRPGFVCAISSLPTSWSLHVSRRGYSDTPRRQQQQQQQQQQPPFPTVPSCPSPTCGCADTPVMAAGLEIDHKSSLRGVISGYAEQVLVCTGQGDWASKIEDENGGDNLAADLKELFGRGGVYSDPFHNISILNSSFPSSAPPRAEVQSTSAYLLPSFKYVPFLPRVSFDSVQALAKGFLLPEKLHSAHDGLSPIHRDRLTRKDAYQSLLLGVQDVQDVLVLICGHGGRDARCGTFGPLLRNEFEEKLGLAKFDVARKAVHIPCLEEGEGKRAAQKAIAADEGDQKKKKKKRKIARVGLVSHIGGHKFAGNVIIYIPPGYGGPGGEEHALAGCGIWYGRVEPKHVEGLVDETIVRGRVVEDMFRGGIDSNRKILRI